MEVDKIGGNNCLNCVKNGGNIYQSVSDVSV